LRLETLMRSLRTGLASGTREVLARLLGCGLRRARRLEVHDFSARGAFWQMLIGLDLNATSRGKTWNPITTPHRRLVASRGIRDAIATCM
jgi:hypothetical protein